MATRRVRTCMFCKRKAQPRGFALCSAHGGNHAIGKARRRHHRRKVQWENSESVWKAHQRRKARWDKIFGKG